MGTAGMHNQGASGLGAAPEQSSQLVYCTRPSLSHLGSWQYRAEGCAAHRKVHLPINGERVRVYPDPLLRSKARERFPTAIEWPPASLPDEYLALLAPARQAFIKERERTVTHGGICIEEVILPLVRVERRDT